MLRRVSSFLVFVVVGLAGLSFARAQSVNASGVLDWTALTNFKPKSSQVVFLGIYTGERVVSTPTPLTTTTASYAVTLSPGTLYFAFAVLGDCAGDPASCGTSTTAGTHIRTATQSLTTPTDGSPIVVNLTADASLNPVAICGAVQVDSGTFVRLSASVDTGFTDNDFTPGVFSTASVSAPASSYCVEAAPSTSVQLDATITIAQTRLPTCPAQLDVQHTDSLFVGAQPITDNLHVVVPPPPGEIRGTFSVAGFSAMNNQVSASTPGVTIAACAGLTSFSASGGGGPLAYDFTPALAGAWSVSGIAASTRITADGLLQVVRGTMPTIGDAAPTATVVAGKATTPPLSYNAAVLSGSVSVDARRWGGPSSENNFLPTFLGETQNSGFGAEWGPEKYVLLPMQFAEKYDLYLDPRGNKWSLVSSQGLGYSYQFPVANGYSSAGFGNLVALPNYAGAPPFEQFQEEWLRIGTVAPGAQIAVDLPALDFHVASVTLNPPPEAGPSLSWANTATGKRTLPKGVLLTPGCSLSTSMYDGSAPVAHGFCPPGRYDGQTDFLDPNYTDTFDPRPLDLEADDDLTADFGAPTLVGVLPVPGAAGGSTKVTGTVASSDPHVTKLRVTVNGAPATIGTAGAFSAPAVIGTGPLTIVASDNLGRVTTLKRYFTTIAGLFAPCNGAELVSLNQDVNAITNSGLFLPALAKTTFAVGQTIALKLTGALGAAPVTSANSAKAPRVVGLVQAAQGVPPTTVNLPSPTVFSYTSGQWAANLSTKGLTAGTYVVQIQFWDGRTLEAAFVLK